MQEFGLKLAALARGRLLLLLLTATMVTALITATAVMKSDNGSPRNITSPAPVTPSAVTVSSVAATATFVDINPDNEGPIAGQSAAGIDPCPEPCASGHTGGRVHNLAAAPGISGFVPTTYYAASEVGGLFKSVNGGASWSHLDGYVPGRAWDVAATPDGQRVYATSFNEGRRDLSSVLQVSTDGGQTWIGRLPNAPVTCSPERSGQPSAFGIELRSGTSEALVGTNCGIARSTDGGDHWTRFDPNAAGSVWDVAALPGGRTYACGGDGLLVSPSGAPGVWPAFPRPTGTGEFCSLAVSPEESNVVFVMFGNPTSYGEVFGASGGDLFQGVVAFDSTGTATGVTWLKLPNPDAAFGAKARLPFVVTNERTTGYDVWAGISNLVRGTCTTPASLPAPMAPRCNSWTATYTDNNGGLPQNAHGDSGDLVFDPTLSVDACPQLYSSDGGIYTNIRSNDPTMCHDPEFRGANVGLHAFLLWDMEGVSIAGADAEDIYFGTQDNGLYYSGNAGGNAPSWIHGIGADAYDLAADETRVAVSMNDGNVLAGNRGFVNMTLAAPAGTIKANPPLDIPGFIARAGSGRFMIAINVATSFSGLTIPIGIRDTNDIVNNPLGSALGTWPVAAAPPCHIAVGSAADGPQPYVLAGRCFWPDSGARSPFAGDQLWTYREISPGVKDWRQIAVPPKRDGDTVLKGAGFGLIAVDPANARRLYASIVLDGDPRMMRSSDGGAHWVFDEQLTDLMSGNGQFVPYPVVTGDGIFPYLQPQMVSFDPADPRILVAGGDGSGVFLSGDGGQNWSLLTDPLTPGTSGIPHLPRPMFAHFDHDKAGFVRIYLGTGRGIWRIDLPIADVRITKTDSPDPAFAGESLTYTMTITNYGPSAASGVTVGDRLPAGVTYDSGPAFCSEAPIGTLLCTIGTLAPGAQASFNITVNIAPNLVYLNGGPKTITNSATVSANELDLDRLNNTATQNTLVKAKADAAVVSFDPITPPAAVVIGQPVGLTLHKVITNRGPSAPVDVAVSRTAVAPPGSTVTPAASSGTASAVAKDEQRSIEETFTITCGVPGSQTFTFANAIQLASPDDLDPDTTNNHSLITLTVQCVVPVAINIKPHGFPNAINFNGMAPTAVLTTRAGEYGLPLAFDASKIDAASVLFGPASLVFSGTGGSTPNDGKGHIEDSYELDEKTRDRDLDMVLQFPVGNSGLMLTSTQACVKGRFSGPGGILYEFFGCDSVKISP